MGITAKLQRESGGEELAIVEDPTNVLHRILPSIEDSHFQCLRFIDWYGDTTFNHLQAPQLLSEWRMLEVDVSDAETQRVFTGIRELAERLIGTNHVYLVFIGD